MTIEEQFREFHADNPDVYRTLVRLARRALRGGRRRIGIGNLWEVMRWELTLQLDDASEFKLNNNFRSRYARLVMQHEPDLRGVFETRRLLAA